MECIACPLKAAAQRWYATSDQPAPTRATTAWAMPTADAGSGSRTANRAVPVKESFAAKLSTRHFDRRPASSSSEMVAAAAAAATVLEYRHFPSPVSIARRREEGGAVVRTAKYVSCPASAPPVLVSTPSPAQSLAPGPQPPRECRSGRRRLWSRRRADCLAAATRLH